VAAIAASAASQTGQSAGRTVMPARARRGRDKLHA